MLAKGILSEDMKSLEILDVPSSKAMWLFKNFVGLGHAENNHVVVEC
jgi:hypothetical protein